MNIPLGNDYRLSADKYQWIVQKEYEGTDTINGEKVKSMKWKSLSFHGTINQAINHHANVLVRTSDAETLAEALKVIDSVVTELTQVLSPVFDVNIHKEGKK